MTQDLIIIGCGGFGRELVGIVDAINATTNDPAWNLLGFADDDPSAIDLSRLDGINIDYLGRTNEIDPLLSDKGARFIIGVGLPHPRRAIADRVGRDSQAATLIDPRARIGRGVRTGRGVVVAAGAHVTTNIDIGDHVHIDRGVEVGHDSSIGAFTTVHPGAVISGGCHVGSIVRVGTSATILPSLVVGDESVIGAAACVARKVAAGSTVAGVPARSL